jgi:protein-S-isoprenylcysteine O-methyltransferase Ste14
MMGATSQVVSTELGARPRSRVADAMDLVERGLVLGLYVWLVTRIVADYAEKGSAVDLILLPSEGLVVLLLLVRRSAREISHRPSEWAAALCASVAPLLVRIDSAGAMLPPLLAAVIMLAGMVIQVHAKLALGRSFGCVPANRGLKFSGPYRFVRHPMYAGYLLTHVAFLLMNPTLRNVVLYSSCYLMQVFRILAEERLLSKDHSYLNYIATVRYRLVPPIF